MHPLGVTFLALLLAHLLTDFVFQSSRLVALKKQGLSGAYLSHGAIHLAAAFGLVAFAWPAALLTWRSYVVLAALVGIHLLVDHAKLALVSAGVVGDGLGAFVADQSVHAATVFAAAAVITQTKVSSLLAREALPLDREKILWVLVVYVGTIWGGGYLLRYLTKPLIRRGLPDLQEGADELENAGLYIGWLERFLVLTALLLRSPAMVGLILTAKSIARYPEFRSFRFAEYFLIGTLLSVSVGILGGVLLAYELHLPVWLLP